MSAVEIFNLVTWLGNLVPIIIFSLLIFWPRLLAHGYRALIGIISSWIFLIIYTIYLYNPAGIAAGHEVGMHFPESRYDNNTIVPALVSGWLYPALLALIYYVGIRVWKQFSKG
jgi:hypothetical protein